MELGIIRQVNIEAEMQASYLDYAMSVIVARALPDVRDGLKPVHRRILYAMHDLGMQPDKPYKKSARIVGEVLGKYHPHGDTAVYEAMVRMAQDFSLRYPLVDGQGNFGSVDGDNAAAMRYTEARLSKIAVEMLADIDKDTVEWSDNFDGTLKEPKVLPAALPNLLVNGASGIAVGMSTNIPPHNLGEVCDALAYLIEHYDHHDDVTLDDLLRFIPGPDFPTGGLVYRYAGEGEAREDVIAHAYAGGRGSIIMQAKAHVEEMSRSKNRIVITELPYQVNKSSLIERIADLVRDGRIEGITDLRDESDRTGMRVCIELTRTVDPKAVLADLFKLTPLQTTFGVSLLALVADHDGHSEPKLLSLKRMLLHFLEHRQEVIVRRSEYDLARARARAHILEGLLRALDVLDEIITLIRGSKSAEDAKLGLIKQFTFSEIQAQAILDMQLRRLAALERRKLQDEYKEVKALITELEALLLSPAKVLALIKQNLADLKAKYGDARRTQIIERAQGVLTTHDLLPDENVWVGLTAEGLLSRQRTSPPAALFAVATHTRADQYLFSAKGQVSRVQAHQIPEAPGGHFADLSGFTRRDRVVALLALPQSVPGGQAAAAAGFLLLASRGGKVKRVALADVADAIQTHPSVIALDDGDELVAVAASDGQGQFLLATAQGQAIRFGEDEVRTMGLAAGGIGGVKLAAKDRVVGGGRVSPAADAPAGESANPPSHLALVTALGWGKRVALADFPAQGRNGQGVVALKTSDRTGDLAGAALVASGDRLTCRLSGGALRNLPVSDLPELARPAQGKLALTLRSGERVEQVWGLRVGAEAELASKEQPPQPAQPPKKAPAAGPSAPPAPVAQPAARKAKAVEPAPPPAAVAQPAARKAKAVAPAPLPAPVAQPAAKQAKAVEPASPPAPVAQPAVKQAKAVEPASPPAPVAQPAVKQAKAVAPAPPPAPVAQPAVKQAKAVEPASPPAPVAQPAVKQAKAVAPASPPAPVVKPALAKQVKATEPAPPPAPVAQPAVKQAKTVAPAPPPAPVAQPAAKQAKAVAPAPPPAPIVKPAPPKAKSAEPAPVPPPAATKAKAAEPAPIKARAGQGPSQLSFLPDSEDAPPSKAGSSKKSGS